MTHAEQPVVLLDTYGRETGNTVPRDKLIKNGPGSHRYNSILGIRITDDGSLVVARIPTELERDKSTKFPMKLGFTHAHIRRLGETVTDAALHLADSIPGRTSDVHVINDDLISVSSSRDQYATFASFFCYRGEVPAPGIGTDDAAAFEVVPPSRVEDLIQTSRITPTLQAFWEQYGQDLPAIVEHLT